MSYEENPYRGKAIETGFFSTQYRYDSEGAIPCRTTKFLKAVLEFKAGDILLLTMGNGIQAFGYVKKCPYESEQISSIEKVINTQKHGYTEGIVRFSDSDVFYENLEGGIKGWGQRISVDKWHCYFESPEVYTDKLPTNLRTGYSIQDTLCGVSKKFGKGKIKDLKRSKN